MTVRARLSGMCVVAAMFVLIAAVPSHAGATRAAGPILLGAAARAKDVPTERYYVAIPGGDEDELTRIFHELDAAGASRIHAFMPDLIVCDVPVDVDARAIARGPGVTVAAARDVSRLSGLRLRTPPRAIEEGFETMRRWHEDGNPDAVAAAERARRDGYEIGESRRIPVEAIYASKRRADRINAALPSSGAASTDDARLLHQCSEMMIGTIVVNVVIPESDYPQYYYEDWTPENIDQVHLGVFFAMNEFMDEFENADINTIYKYYDQVSISTEPIYSAPSNDKFWIALCMRELGYPTSEADVLNAVHALNDDVRRRHAADWAFTMFIALAEKKERWSGATFNNARKLSWGYLGGPYWVTSYPAAGFREAAGVMQIARHEIGNIFWGLEEDVGPSTSCEDRSGYLNAPHGNKVVAYDPIFGSRQGCGGGLIPIPCIMNEFDQIGIGWDQGACVFSRQHMGVSDINENQVPDALDRAPVIEFFAADIETITTPVPYFDVRVRSLAIPNQNPFQPGGLRRDYAARIQDIDVAVGGLNAYTLEPKDIGSNGYEAQFRVDLPPFIPGRLDVVVGARNEYFATSAPRVKQYRYVHLKYLGFERTNPDNGVRLRWNMIGELFGADFALHRRNEDTGEVVVINEGFAPAGPTVSGVTPFDVLDDTPVPGAHYTYWVTGTIDLPNSAGTIHKVVASTPVHAQGALARNATPASTISNVAPNPFTARTWLSLNVPHTPTTPPGGGATVDRDSVTRVKISVYDVLGRRVNELYRRDVVDDVVTLSWDGTDDAGRALPSGVYFMSVEVGPVREIRKVMLIR